MSFIYKAGPRKVFVVLSISVSSSDWSGSQKSGSVRALNFVLGSGRVLKFFFRFKSGSVSKCWVSGFYDIYFLQFQPKIGHFMEFFSKIRI